MSHTLRKKIRIILSYDGSSYCGWSRQKNADPTLQKVLEHSLSKMFKQDIKIVASGRTDKGVHAIKQNIMFWIFLNSKIDLKKIKVALNRTIPKDIYIKSVAFVKDSFHCQYDVKWKTYLYIINFDNISCFKTRYCWFIKKNDLININDVNKVIDLFIGKKDFLSYYNNSTKEQVYKFIKTIKSIKIETTSKKMKFFITGNGFGQNMVRLIVGVIVDYLCGKASYEFIQKTINHPSNIYLIFKAPPEGLYLYSVKY